ncbi:MAG: DUF507 family protein [Sulfurimonas sp.]|jgi:hypothetical protein|uniref:DUF507 family protein n=1 Tax=unclassified Sulfurimonas TaxID=2623549 RepID=UPI0008ADF5DA|nr:MULTISPECIES: DUF507 family protein [unclassified Sulfurimonas]OHE08370.1 MAG: hypothetical protein A2329_06865 [Sulfurimonas sp. RIFOXYB2_FULL_37_5]MBS4067138.1 DUF507 family protein [Sulfurimonas sp.]MDD3854666.1 DUF507 family protein [Sulfurimonas sp.]MDX9756996.1 DUF507 family protein [Sulfurimonas sp.]OHE03424.1 MAG: hypothetical protein A2345_08580 [Sulfurimonas sp. RIFOXYB12_FULL_35_9]
MKISLKTIPHISNKIAIDLNKSGVVTMTRGLEPVMQEAQKILAHDVKQEVALEEKVNEICQDNEEEIEFNLVDERQLFYMIKKKLAPEFGVILNYEERYSDLSHKILDELYEEDLIHFDVTENRIKNIIYNAITSFIAESSQLDNAIMDKIKTYKKRYVPGTDEFDILYEKLYKEEMIKRGME